MKLNDILPIDPSPGPKGVGPKNANARVIHLSNSHTKFGCISLNGLGGDSITDGRTDGGNYNIPFAFLGIIILSAFAVMHFMNKPMVFSTRAIMVI